MQMRYKVANQKKLGIVVDIGTTTVSVYLYQMEDVRLLYEMSALNTQTQYGADAITRIQYCCDQPTGLEELHIAITAQLNEMISICCENAGVDVGTVSQMVVVGNTVMLHLLRNLSPVSMGKLPFTPLSHFGETVTGAELGIAVNGECYLPPCASAFIGADVTSGMLYTRFGDGTDGKMLLDIGTNGEMVLQYKGKILTASAAAGPAFEGTHISCGTGGVTGAINCVYQAGGGKIAYTLLGDADNPIGLCGSGILDAMAVFRATGDIDASGRIQESSQYAFHQEGELALQLTEHIFVTQSDVREFQNAKAAVAAGLLTLLHSVGMQMADIETLYIAGGFGNQLELHSAQVTGLIPMDINAVRVNNAAAAGGAMILFNRNYKKQVEQLWTKIRHVELGHNPYFMQKFINCMHIEPYK